MANQTYYELYRRSSIGLALIDTLDGLVHDGRLEPQLAMKVINSFDRAITEVLAGQVKARLNFKVVQAHFLCSPMKQAAGHLDTYRFCDEVWTFLIKDVNFKLDNQSMIQADKVKIVSCNSKKPGET
ncbi:MAG: Transcription initiation factor IIA small chain (TFIIA 13.5 kDa subunit) [Icmadophila ericetorum]|nr:Transcription initiation factor IIA small chain (TFIIA 13.5 kDa subunit) [Icmadophila ericetorum]